MIYYLTLFLCGSAYVHWYFAQRTLYQTVWAVCTLLSFAAYFGSFFLWDFPLMQKGILVFKDLLLISVLGAIMSLVKSKTILRIPFWISTLIILCYSSFYLTNEALSTANTLQGLSHTDDNKFLIEINRTNKASLFRFLKTENVPYYWAFEPKDKTVTTLDDYIHIDLSNIKNRAKILNQIEHHPATKYIENDDIIQLKPITRTNNKIIQHKTFVNDPHIGHQWSVREPYFLALERLLASKQAQHTAKIYILDTGIDAKHEDLKDVYHSINEQYDNDRQGHGTHCAGIAGATTNNRIGIASFNTQKNIQLTGIKVLNNQGFGSQEKIIDGIIEAADNGADVISLSLGAISSVARRKAYTEAVHYANLKNAIVVTSAGNSNSPATQYTPANIEGVICVGAHDINNQKSAFSNTTEDISMSIFAPGTDIYSTLPNNQYKPMSGTSMSAPYVAGIIGIIRSIYPKINTAEVHQLLEQTSRKQHGLSILDPVNLFNALSNE